MSKTFYKRFEFLTLKKFEIKDNNYILRMSCQWLVCKAQFEHKINVSRFIQCSALHCDNIGADCQNCKFSRPIIVCIFHKICNKFHLKVFFSLNNQKL